MVERFLESYADENHRDFLTNASILLIRFALIRNRSQTAGDIASRQHRAIAEIIGIWLCLCSCLLPSETSARAQSRFGSAGATSASSLTDALSAAGLGIDNGASSQQPLSAH